MTVKQNITFTISKQIVLPSFYVDEIELVWKNIGPIYKLAKFKKGRIKKQHDKVSLQNPPSP